MKTKEYSPKWLIEKIESSETEADKLYWVLKFEQEAVRTAVNNW